MPAPEVGAVVNGYRFGGGDPHNQTSWMPLTGDEYISTLSPDRAMFAKNMAEGKIPYPGSFALKSPQWMSIITDAQRYDPTFDATLWPARTKMRTDANAGKMGQNINAINTAIQHAGVLAKDVPETWSTPLQPLNWLGNMASEATGAPGVTNYDNAAAALAHELRRVYAQVGAGSQADLDKFEKNLSRSKSREQKLGALKTQMELLVGKVNANRDQYQNIMGPTSKPIDVLHPESIEALKAMGFTPEDLGIEGDKKKTRKFVVERIGD